MSILTGVFLTSPIFAFGMAIAIGAQDVANALGTSVGSHALTVRQAVIIASIFEFLGTLSGGEVTDTLSKGIISIESIGNSELYVVVMFSTLAGALVWLIIATYFALPVSTTHSLVGSLVVLCVVLGFRDSLNVDVLLSLLSSWLSSPFFGGLISYIVFYILRNGILMSSDPTKSALFYLPYVYGFTFSSMTIFLTTSGPQSLRSHNLLSSVLSSFFVGLIVFWFIREIIFNHKKISYILGSFITSSIHRLLRIDIEFILNLNLKSNPNTVNYSNDIVKKSDKKKTKKTQKIYEEIKKCNDDICLSLKSDTEFESDTQEKVFIPLMVVTACALAFAHGSNDVSNAVGPFAGIVAVYFQNKQDTSSSVPYWVLLCGGIGIVLGLSIFGYRVISTVGEKITSLTFIRGYSVQIATTITVLTATMIHMSVSTTHCLVGAITGVALVDSQKINKDTLKRIVLSWVVTVPASSYCTVIIYVFLSWLQSFLFQY